MFKLKIIYGFLDLKYLFNLNSNYHIALSITLVHLDICFKILLLFIKNNFISNVIYNI